MPLLPINARIAYEGDSITAGSNGPSWIWAAIPTGAHKAYHPVGYNQAVGGQTAAQMATQTDDVMALNPHVVVLLAGTNDLSGLSDSAQTIFDNIKACRDAYLAGSALKVVVVKVLPRNGVSALDSTREARRVELNSLIGTLANADTTIVDLESIFNPTIHCDDGLHPNGFGSQIVGSAIGPVIGSLFEEGKITDKFNDPDALLVTLGENPQFLGTEGSSPSGWTFEQNTSGCTVTQSKEDNGNGTFKHVFHVVGTNDTSGRIVNLRNMAALNAQIGEAYDYAIDFELMAGHKGLAIFATNSTDMSSPSMSTNAELTGGLALSGTMRSCQTAIRSSIQASYNLQNIARIAVSEDIDFTIKISQPYARKSIPEPALVWPEPEEPTDPDPEDPENPEPPASVPETVSAPMTGYGRRKFLSEVLKGTGQFEEATANNHYFVRTMVHSEETVAVSTVGTVVVWVEANDRFEPLVDGMTIPTGGSTLPDGMPLAVVLGPRTGIGMAPGYVMVGDEGTELSVLFRGDANVVREGLELSGMSEATVNAVILQLNKQKISVSNSAQSVTPSFIAH